MVRKDKEINKLINAIEQESAYYSLWMKTIGNPTASTDRVIENIIKNAKILEGVYESQFKAR